MPAPDRIGRGGALLALRGLAAGAGLALVLGVPGSGQADNGTLADIRTDLQALATEIGALRRELAGTGAQGAELGTGTLLDRVEAAEAELTRLTGATERLELRIERIVQDATNRIGDLEFRLVELEGGDIGAVGRTPLLGGEPSAAEPTPVAPALPLAGEDGGQALMAVGEREDFERARRLFDEGDHDGAASRLAAFIEAYPGGPLTVEAHVLRARALGRLGRPTETARAWLDAFNADPDGPQAARALFGLGLALGDLGQRTEGCLMLDEVALRFPNSDEAAQLSDARQRLGC